MAWRSKPLLAKAGVGWLAGRKVCAKWTRPHAFDRNLVVIGVGAGGLVSACSAAAVTAEFTRVEGHKLGGDCLNFGGVPSQALIRSAKMARQQKSAHERGVADAAGRVDFAALMRRVHEVIAAIEPHDSVKRYTEPGVAVLQGHAGDLLAEDVWAMKHGLGLNKALGTIHTDPTPAEADMHAAGEWNRAPAPKKRPQWVGRHHAWERA